MYSPSLLDQEFLPTRARLLDIAATLDRLERAGGSADDDPRTARLVEAIGTLLVESGNRAERLQMLFSRPYQVEWRRQFKMKNHE